MLQGLRNSFGYAFAASFRDSLMYLSRQAAEQKCNSSSSWRSGSASVSARCIPQTGSRTSFRPSSSPGTSTYGCDLPTSRPMRCTKRRKSAALQETTSSQNKYLRMFARNVIYSYAIGRYDRPTRPSNPLGSVEVSLCRALRRVKQKAVNSRACAPQTSSLGPPIADLGIILNNRKYMG